MKEINVIKLHYYELIENLLREQRHDFLNEIQIIYGYIKLNKIDKAIDYINQVSKDAKICSKISNLSCIELYIMLSEKFKRAKSLGIDINFEVYSDAQREEFMDKGINKVISLFEEAVDVIIDSMYNNSDFEEYIFYIEETCENFILKIDLYGLNSRNDIKEKFKELYGKVTIEEDYLIYELELS